MTDTLEDYEAHEKGSRHFIEEGYFGAGDLDASGKLWYYNLEDMKGFNSPYLRFYLAPNEILAREWDRTSARGNTWVDSALDDGNEYLVYYFIVTENGVRKTLVYDVQLFYADAETRGFEHYFGYFFFKNAKRLYASKLIEAGNVGDEVATLFYKDGVQWGDGSLHPKIQPPYEITYGNDGETDWMLYRFTDAGDVNAAEEFYFELDKDGNVLLETAEMGCRVWYQNSDRSWGYDAFYIAPNPSEFVFTMLFGLGKVGGDGETHYFENPLIVKHADGEFTVYAEDEAWNVSLDVDQEARKIVCTITAADEVAIDGQIVFDEDSERTDHDFGEKITLRLSPANDSASGASATIIYSDGEDNLAVKGGFTLVYDNGYFLCDEAGHKYAVDLTWSPQSTENSVTIHGEFVAEEEIKDYEGAMNTAYYGYFGLAGVEISHKMWWWHFGEVARKSTCLNVYSRNILNTPQYIDPVYGEYYCMYDFIPGDGGYMVDLYLTNGGERTMLIHDIRYMPETLTWTTKPIFVDNGYQDGWEKYAITKSTLLYSAKLFGLEVGAEFYTAYVYDEPTHIPARQFIPTTGHDENSERDWLFIKDAETGLLFYVDFDENDNITRIYEAYAGFVFDFAPDVSAGRPYAFGALLMSNEEDIYTPKGIYNFGYMVGDDIYYPQTKITENADNTFTVSELAPDGETVVNQWKVSFTDLNAEVPVPHVTEVAVTPDYSLAFNWVYAETGASSKAADVFFVAPSAVNGKEGQEVLNFSYTSARRNFKGAIDMEKGIYDDNARFFAPYYRQAVLYDYKLESEELEGYLAAAYADVRDAFVYYMEHWNNGRPVILAGFSQGADHCIRLMKEFFRGSDPFQYNDRLVACYAIGWCVTEEEVSENNLKFAESENDTGVIVSFNTEAVGMTESLTVPKGTTALCINPLNWTRDNTPASKDLNKGACFFDSHGNLLETKDHLTGAYIDETRGTLKVPTKDIDPDVYNNTLGDLLGTGVYHYYDYQFFYKNLEENVKTRIAAYLASHN